MRAWTTCLLAVLAASTLVAAGAARVEAATIVDFAGLSVGAGFPTQTGRLDPAPASTCATPQATPTVMAGAYQLRVHTLRGAMTEPVCIIVRVTTGCVDPNGISSAAYVPTHDRLDPAANHVAHLGGAVSTTGAYGFVLPPSSRFAVTVYELNAGQGCGAYGLKLTSQGPFTDTPPTVQGAAAVGSTLTAADAPWKAGPAPTVARQWLRCDRAGTACVDIPGATGATYTVADDDLGGTLRFRNTATEALGTNSSDSEAVDPYIPIVTSDGALGPGDRVQQGNFIRNSIETPCGVPPSTVPTILQPAMAYLYDTAPVTSLLNEEACLVARVTPGCIGGATPSIHSPAFVPGAIGTNYRGNAGGDPQAPGTAAWLLPPGASAEIATSAIQPGTACAAYAMTIGADVPFALARPVVGGFATADGPGLTASTGTWTGAPALAYAWLRCDATGNACAAIPGATGAVHVPTAADVGARLRVRVSATRGRTVSSDSEPSALITAAPQRPAPQQPPRPRDPVPTPSPRDTRPPVARLTVPRTSLQTVLRRGWLALTVRCDEACRLTVDARVSRRAARRAGGRTTLARAAATSLRAGQTATARVTLTRGALRALRRNRPSALAVTFHVAVVDAAGNRRTLTQRARVTRSRPR